jgi:eukaryotic-like serine/threonine-protein kinase
MVGHVDEGRLVAGRYRLLERIGRGGMGTVWRAEDELLARQVAVKKLHPPQPHMDDDELATVFERTRREARAAARISHPNVIVVHDVVDDAGLPTIVMEYVPSVTLGERLKKEGALAPAEAARIGRGMIAALRAAHRAGVLHRDVKPGNVLLGEDSRVVLTDFGIAQASGTSTLTRTGELIGSIDFLSPERIRGAPPGPESDLWALGATLYQAVEGVSAFRRPTAIETAYAIAEDPVRPPAHAGVLAEVIAGLLAKEPTLRLSAEDAERMLRVPAAEQDTALVDRARFEAAPGEPPTGPVTHHSGTVPPQLGQQPYSSQDSSQNPSQNPFQNSSHSGGRHAFHQTYGAPDQTPTPTPTPTPSPSPGSPPPRGRRAAPWLAGVVAAVVLAGGGYLAADHLRSDDAAASAGGSTGAPTTPTTPTTTQPTPPPTTAASSPPAVPDGFHLAREADHGYSVPVPDGWTRKVESGGDEVDWIDPSGLVGLKVSSLAFASTDPYEHWQTLEPQTEGQVADYHRERMDRTRAFGEPAALWQFTFKGKARDWRAVDLGFGRPGATEYAIYLSAPQDQWQRYKPVFDTATAGFRQSG